MAYRPGQSGNPAGKKPGTLNKKTRVALALDAAAEDVTKAVIEAAKGGDVQACRLVLERVQPPLRATAELVQFDLDPAAPVLAQAQAVVTAVAQGRLNVDHGKVLIDCLHGLTALRHAEELLARIELLEASLGDQGGGHYRGNVMRTDP